MTLADLRAALSIDNVAAFLRVIRERESSQDPSAYTIINGGAHFSSFAAHPYAGLLTSQGGKAAGAYQFIPSTWAEVAKLYSLMDFSPQSQDLGAVGRVVYRGALDDVIAGRFEQAVAKCRQEWTSLPGASESRGDWTMEKAKAVFLKYAGGIADGERAPRDDMPTQLKPEIKQMGALAALQLFGPILSGLIPQIASILKPESEVAKRNVGLAQTIVDTITSTANAPNLQAAVEKMQADPAVKNAVQKAVVTEPTVITTLQISEVGGGITGARQADALASASDKPFYKTSAVFWVSVLLIPLVYWLVGSLIVGGMAQKVPSAPPWVQMLLAMFGDVWTGEARSGGFNLVVGLVLGGICGVYFGISVTQQKQQGTAATPPKEA